MACLQGEGGPGFLLVLWFCSEPSPGPLRPLSSQRWRPGGQSTGAPRCFQDVDGAAVSSQSARRRGSVPALREALTSLPFLPRPRATRASWTWTPRPRPCWKSAGGAATAKGSGTSQRLNEEVSPSSGLPGCWRLDRGQPAGLPIARVQHRAALAVSSWSGTC